MPRVYDKGKQRQFYQILSAFVPGQTYNYSPVLNLKNNPNLTTRVISISNSVKMDDKEKATIVYWSADKIKAKISELSGKSITEVDFDLIKLYYSMDVNITVGMEIYPKTFISKEEQKVFLVWKPVGRDISQAQFLFCDSNGKKGLHEFMVSGKDKVELTLPEEEDWKKQRILLEGGKYPLSQMFAYENDYNKINSEYVKKPDWRFRPILSGSRIIFTPIQFSDVFYPEPATQEKVFKYALEEIEKIKIDELKQRDPVIKLLIEHGQDMQISDLRQMEKSVKPELKLIIHKIVDVHEKARSETVKEAFKLEQLEKIPPKRKRIASETENSYLKSFSLKSVSYLEPLQCIEMCIGWITGKSDPGITSRRNPDLAPLRPLQLKYDKNIGGIRFDPNNNEWRVLYDMIDSEGLLFRFDKDTSFEAKHTFAHLILKVLPDFCGISEGLLSEQMFQTSLADAILIFSKEPGEFKTYGLKHVFDNSLQDVLESAKEFRECPFESDNAGCYYCLNKATGCITFNLGLDKSKLDEIIW